MGQYYNSCYYSRKQGRPIIGQQVLIIFLLVLVVTIAPLILAFSANNWKISSVIPIVLSSCHDITFGKVKKNSIRGVQSRLVLPRKRTNFCQALELTKSSM